MRDLESFWPWIQDGKNSHPGSGINIPDPQQCFEEYIKEPGSGSDPTQVTNVQKSFTISTVLPCCFNVCKAPLLVLSESQIFFVTLPLLIPPFLPTKPNFAFLNCLPTAVDKLPVPFNNFFVCRESCPRISRFHSPVGTLLNRVWDPGTR